MKNKTKFLQHWSAMRTFRLILSLVLLIGYFQTSQTFFAIMAGVLFLQAIFNISCPGGSCSTSASDKTSTKTSFIIEDYKPKNEN